MSLGAERTLKHQHRHKQRAWAAFAQARHVPMLESSTADQRTSISVGA